MTFKFISWSQGEEDDSKDNNVVMFLALMLLLLAFFILLNSMSVISTEKYTQAVKSIEASFNVKEGLMMDKFMNSSNAGAEIGADPNLQDLADLFKTELPLMKVRTINDGRTLKVTLKIQELFDSSQKLNVTYYALFDRMIDLLNSDPYVLYGFISRKQGDFDIGFKNVSFAQVDILNRYLNKTISNKSQVNLGIDFSGDQDISFYLSKEENNI